MYFLLECMSGMHWLHVGNALLSVESIDKQSQPILCAYIITSIYHHQHILSPAYIITSIYYHLPMISCNELSIMPGTHYAFLDSAMSVRQA